MHAWPCFVVGKVGTDLGKPVFDPEVARRLYERVVPLGSLIQGALHRPGGEPGGVSGRWHGGSQRRARVYGDGTCAA